MNDQIIKRAQALREGGHTQRLHTVPVHLDASVAKHSCNMAILLNLLWPSAPKHLIIACLLHDHAERWVGDTPAPAKYSIEPELGHLLHRAEAKVEASLDIMQEEIDPYQKAWLKAIDILEFLMHCEDELAMGNRHIEISCRNARAILNGDWVPITVQEFVKHYKWSRTSDLIDGDTMEELTDEQHTQR